jgi:thiol:disulfide interchange protein
MALAAAAEPYKEESEQPEQQQAQQDDAEEIENLPEDTTYKSSSAASRLNAIVSAATFLSNADPSIKEKMVFIVKKEFSDYSGYVSKKCRNHSTTSIITLFHLIHILLSSHVIIPCYHPMLSLHVIIPCYHSMLSLKTSDN